MMLRFWQIWSSGSYASPQAYSVERTRPGDEAALLLLLFLSIWERVKKSRWKRGPRVRGERGFVDLGLCCGATRGWVRLRTGGGCGFGGEDGPAWGGGGSSPGLRCRRTSSPVAPTPAVILRAFSASILCLMRRGDLRARVAHLLPIAIHALRRRRSPEAAICTAGADFRRDSP
jgi:hypothetical protein